MEAYDPKNQDMIEARKNFLYSRLRDSVEAGNVSIQQLNDHMLQELYFRHPELFEDSSSEVIDAAA